MNDKLGDILNEDDVKSAIDELSEDIKDFDKVDFVHILWGKRVDTGEAEIVMDVKQRFYGSDDVLIAELEKAKFAFLADSPPWEEGK